MYNTPIELVIDILRNNPPRVFNDYLIKYSTTENEKIATVKYIHIKRPPKDIIFTENELNESGYKTEQGGTVIKFSGAINQVDNTVGVRIDITLELDANNNVTKMAIDFTSLYNQTVVATEFVSYTYGYEDNGEFTGERLNPADFPTYNG